MRKKNILLVLATFAFSQILTAQNEREITLNEAIALARTQSVDAAVALNELKTAYWEYRTFRADLLPEVNLTGTLPNYKKSYKIRMALTGLSVTIIWSYPVTCPLTRIYG